MYLLLCCFVLFGFVLCLFVYGLFVVLIAVDFVLFLFAALGL